MPSIINATTTNGLVSSADNSGSLQLATNNGTTAVTIDTSQRVGIGTSSPAFTLDVRAATSVISAVSTTGTNAAYIFASNTGGDFYLGRDSSAGTTFGGGAYSANIYSAGAYPMVFWTNGSERMRISSTGVITTPFRPAFVANVTGSGIYTSVAADTPFPANTTNYNQGSCYNTSNYRFTAPVTGLYLFTFSALNNNTSSGSRPTFYVNGASGYNGIQHGISNQDGGGSNSNTTSSLIYLQANDYVFVASQSGSLYYFQSAHSTFSGCLIG